MVHIRRRGFTLVELLVVIGIIAVLIAILIPAISGAQRAAKTTACAATLRSLGQALTGYVSEYKSYPYGYYVAFSTSSAAGASTVGDNDPNKNVYVWWSVIRGYMRGRGAPMDNSIQSDDGSTLTRFMEAFNCPVGLNREAGCDFIANGAVMIQKDLEEGSAGHPINRQRGVRPQRPSGVYPDTVLLWDGPEVGSAYNSQYVISYTIDVGPNAERWRPTNGIYGMLGSPKKVSWRYRNVNSTDRTSDPKNYGDNTPIHPGPNQEVSGGNVDRTAGGIRWRHGKNEQANFLFADGSVKAFTITKNWESATPRGDLLRKYFRSKIPPNYITIDGPG